MTTTPQSSAAPAATETQSVALQIAELVLKTGRYDDMAAFYTHVLGHGPFYERTPDPDSPPRPAGMPERAVDVRLGFFRVHDAPHSSQVLALFGISRHRAALRLLGRGGDGARPRRARRDESPGHGRSRPLTSPENPEIPS
ncbi:hypothetical protein ACWD4T_32560 [Streptomyces umbrinus]